MRPARRPTTEEAERRSQLPVLVQAYAEAGGDDTPGEWLLSAVCRSLCAAKGWALKEHAPPAAAVESAPAGATATAPGSTVEAHNSTPAGTQGSRPPRQYDGANDTFMAVANAYMHVWARDGSHVDWRSVADLQNKLDEGLNHRVPASTAARWLKAERDRYAAGGGVRTKPDLAELLKKTKAAKQPEAEDLPVTEEPPQTCFPHHLYAELEMRCNELVDVAGFGPDLVVALASQVYHENLAEPDGTVWNVSLEWAYWFMRKELGLVVRRIGSHDTASPEQVEQQQRLHELNVEYVAIALTEGLPAKYVLMSDEFGMFLFPTGDYKWEKKGVKHVSSDLPEDKRQYTGDVVHNAAGEIVHALQIWDGKTDASLPPATVRDKFPNVKFDLSENHWANHDTKTRLLQRNWAWVCAEWAKDGLVGEPQCIQFLDCWPVNLTEKLRSWVKENCPGMRMRFIPAGATGKFQVNDTHLHKPLKDAAKAAAQSWRLAKIMVFRDEYKKAVAGGTDPGVAKAQLHKRVANLMSKKVLRTVAPVFLWEGCKAVMKPGDDGRTIIKKGWDQLYIEKATSSGFVEQARANLIERRVAAAYAAGRADATVAAAAAVAGGVADSVASVTQEPVGPPPTTEEDALVQQVAALERRWHEADEATVAQTGKKRRQGRTDDRARSRAAKRVAAATDAADAPGPAPAVSDDDGAAGAVEREALPPELEKMSKQQLVQLCQERGMAVSGNKSQLIQRLLSGKKRSNRGRPAAQPNVLAGALSEGEEEEAEEPQPERFMDPSLAEEEEPDDPEVDALAAQVAVETAAHPHGFPRNVTGPW